MRKFYVFAMGIRGEADPPEVTNEDHTVVAMNEADAIRQVAERVAEGKTTLNVNADTIVIAALTEDKAQELERLAKN